MSWSEFSDLLCVAVHQSASPLGVASLDMELEGVALEVSADPVTVHRRSGNGSRGG